MVTQEAQRARTRHGQRVGRVVHGVRTEASHLDIYTVLSNISTHLLSTDRDVPNRCVQSAYRTVGEYAPLYKHIA